MKVNKAIGIDEIVNEVWKYGGKKTEEWIRRLCNKVWRGVARRMEGWVDCANKEEGKRRKNGRLQRNFDNAVSV